MGNWVADTKIMEWKEMASFKNLCQPICLFLMIPLAIPILRRYICVL